MEANSKSVEELDALRASFPQLLMNLDKVRFAVTQISNKQQVLDITLQEKLDSLVKSLDVSCSTLSLLTASVYNYE